MQWQRGANFAAMGGLVMALWRSRTATSSRGSTPKGTASSGPLPAPASTSERVTAGRSRDTEPGAANAVLTFVDFLTDDPCGPVRSAELAEEAFRWAEAVSAAGERIVNLGFEDEGIGCYVIAGRLLERAGEFYGAE